MKFRPAALALLMVASGITCLGQNEAALPEILPLDRRIPPLGGVELGAALEAELKERAGKLGERIWEIDFKSHIADAGVLVKAVEFAL